MPRHLSRQPGHLRIPSPKPGARRRQCQHRPPDPTFRRHPRHGTRPAHTSPAAPAIWLRRRGGIGALRTGDVVLFRCEGRHILHRIVGIETGVRCEGKPSRMRTSRRECPVPCGIRGKPRREGFQPRGHSVSPCPGTVITARRSIASARISSP
ncbi:MAG: hypothetical protein ACLUQ6_02120 [Alistipes onderdonkii]